MKHTIYGTRHKKAGEGRDGVTASVSIIICLFILSAATFLSLAVFSAGSATEIKASTIAQATTAAQAPPPAQGTTVPLPAVSVVPPATGGQPNATTPPNSSGGFPWLLVLPVAAIVLAGLLFALMRGRRPAQTVVTTTATTAAPMAASQTAFTPARVASPDAIPTVDETAVNVTQIAPVIDVVALPTFVDEPAGLPSNLTCPNCGTLNDINEKFCHECGQDLRPTRAQLVAATQATQADVVDEYTPYLETQGRVDEQLEYVLSRERITIGSAANNDIVVDSAFQGYSSVAPVHAELRKQGDSFVIVDRGSDTGTYVNNTRVGESALADNDQVRVGDVRFAYHAPARPA